MSKDDIIAIVFMGASFVCFLFWVYWINTNASPDGKRFKRKFIEKLITIFEVTQDNEPIELKYNGHTFNIKVLQEPKQVGVEHSTIPMYTSKLLYINDEAVCRIHDVECNLKHHTFLEFTNKRQIDEVIELTQGAYLVAYIKYQAKVASKKWATRPSFYDEEKQK